MTKEARVRFGIFHKTLITMVFVSIIPLGIIWYINYQSTAMRITQNINHSFQQTSNNLVGYVDNWVDMNYRMLFQNAELADIRSMEMDRQTPIMESIAKEYDWNYLAFTVGLNGKNIARSDGKPLKYYGDRTYVKDVLIGAPKGQQVLIGKTSGLPALVLSVPVRTVTGQLKGVLAIAMTIIDISKRITGTQIGETGYAFLLDKNGKVIAHQSEEYTKTRKNLSEHPAFVALTHYGKESVVFEDERG